MSSDRAAEAFAWQVGIWDRMSDIYPREIDARFAPIVQGVIRRADLQPGERVLDLGTGTGSIALPAAHMVAPGEVLAVDPSPEMLDIARRRAASAALNNLTVLEGRGEQIPAGDAGVDVVLASLSLMYAIDRAAVARECARVLRSGGRFVAAVWAGPDTCDIVRFQVRAGSFAPEPPLPGLGPGALADPAAFLAQLDAAGIEAGVATEVLGFDFDTFDDAWEVLAGVTAAQLSPERLHEARQAVFTDMWPAGDGPRHFDNATRFIVGRRR